MRSIPTLTLSALGFIALVSSSASGATYTANFAIGQLRDAAGTIIADGEGTWAVIVSGTAGNPPASGALPGGLMDGSSLTAANLAQIYTDFNSVVLAVGDYGGFTIQQLGSFTSGAGSGFNGVATAAVEFNVHSAPNPGFSAGTLWGLYWFPGKSLGDILSGTYQIGGFANSSTNIPSGGDAGTSVQAGGATSSVNFYESGFNQNDLSGDATGLSVSRFTAITVPEPSVIGYSAFATLVLLTRCRPDTVPRGIASSSRSAPCTNHLARNSCLSRLV